MLPIRDLPISDLNNPNHPVTPLRHIDRKKRTRNPLGRHFNRLGHPRPIRPASLSAHHKKPPLGLRYEVLPLPHTDTPFTATAIVLNLSNNGPDVLGPLRT